MRVRACIYVSKVYSTYVQKNIFYLYVLPRLCVEPTALVTVVRLSPTDFAPIRTRDQDGDASIFHSAPVVRISPISPFGPSPSPEWDWDWDWD